MTPILALAATAALVPGTPAPTAVRAPMAVPVPVLARCEPKQAATKPPSQALLDAFAILRRERTDKDTLSAKALRMLKLRGIRLADPASARLLRETPSGGRAWVVPVSDVTPLIGGPFVGCGGKFARPVPARPAAVPRSARALHARQRTRQRERRRRARAPQRVFVVPATPAPLYDVAPFPAYPTPLDGKPQEGLVVVAEGDAPAGGGGIHTQLIRGLAAPAVKPCAGPKHDLVSVSGIVPDGVGSVFLTSADGTAVKTEVQDNGYAFLVPPAKARDARVPRYVVWVGGDGTPHVQQVVLSRFPSRMCKAIAARRGAIVEVTPSGLFAPFGVEPRPPVPRPSRAPAPRHP